MISRFLVLIPSFTKQEGLKEYTEFFNNMQVFHPMYSMLYTVNLGLCDYVPFSQIWSHMLHCGQCIISYNALAVVSAAMLYTNYST